MLEKLLSNEENLADCVDSIFEEPGSFKQQLNDDYYPSEQRKANDLADRLSKKKCIYHKSSSLPNLASLIESNEPESSALNRTADEMDASLKMLTKRIKRCVSQLLNKSPNSDLTHKNSYFNEDQQLFEDYSDPHESYYHHQPQISQPMASHPYSSPPQQCGRPHYLNISEPAPQSNSPLASSQQSNSVTGSASSVESCESPNLALNAKGSNYISALAKQLLHKLFVSISGRFFK